MSKEKLNCSFCGRAKPQTQLLIAGLDAHICDKCILQAYGIVKEETTEEKGEAKLDLELHPPKKIKSFLDDYVIGQDNIQIYGLDVHNPVFAMSAALVLIFSSLALITFK